jgi:plastocyanin
MRGRAARLVRWLGMAAAIAIPTGATAFLSAGPAGATDPPAHVTFTADGIQHDDVTIKPGTNVVFINHIDPVALGIGHSVTVQVSGATQNSFSVAPNDSKTVSGYNSGSQPFVIHYSATYKSTTLILLPGTDGKYEGTITVAATKPSSPAPTTQPTTASPSASSQPSQSPTQQPTGHSSGTTSTKQSSASNPQSTIPGYRQPGPDVASQVVPKSNGGTYTPDPTTDSTTTSASKQHRSASTTAHQSSAKRSSSARTTDVAAGDPVTRPATHNSANEQSLDTAASQTGALPGNFNWPAVAAVALLSTVAVALVRTFAAHRYGRR